MWVFSAAESLRYVFLLDTIAARWVLGCVFPQSAYFL